MSKNTKYIILGIFIFVVGLTGLRKVLEHQVAAIFGVSLVLALLVTWGSYIWWKRKEFNRFVKVYPLDAPELLDHLSNTEIRKIQLIVDDLSERGNMPTPEISIIVDTAITAYSYQFDFKKGKIKLTTGLLNKYNQVTWRGIIAHEMSHLANNDTWKGLFRVFISVWVLSGVYLVGLNLIGLLFPLIVFTEIYHSRRREYQADLFALHLTDNYSVLGYMIDSLNSTYATELFLRSEVVSGTATLKERAASLFKLLNYQVIIYGLDVFGTHPHWHKRIRHVLTHQNIKWPDWKVKDFIAGLRFSKKFKGNRSVLDFETIELTKRERSILDLGNDYRQ